MPLLFSYGTLQRGDVQLATLGRRLHGRPDELPRFEPSRVPIDDPRVAAAIGQTHYSNVTFTGDDATRVPGMVFEVADAELATIDAYEATASFARVPAVLASGRHAWVYAHAPLAPDRD